MSLKEGRLTRSRFLLERGNRVFETFNTMIEMAAFVVGVVSAGATIVGVIYQIKKHRLEKREFVRVPKPHAEDLLALSSKIETEKALAAVLSRYIFISPAGKFDTGIFTKVTHRVFLDLLSAVTIDRDRDSLSSILASHIRDRFGMQELPFECIAVPKEGNVILGAECARRLGLRLVVVRTGKAIKFGLPIEGIASTGTRALIVDDVLSDGGFIRECALRLRANGIGVTHSAFLVEREDGNAESLLKGVNLDKSSVSIISDEVLLALARGT
jgi:orotate phosphoribosyltransferase